MISGGPRSLAKVDVELAALRAALDEGEHSGFAEDYSLASIVAETSRKLSEQADRLARTNFELGQGTSLELVEAARRLREAEIQLAVREFELVQAKIRALLSLSICRY